MAGTMTPVAEAAAVLNIRPQGLYASRDYFKSFGTLDHTTVRDARIDRVLAYASRKIDLLTGNIGFLPYVASYNFDYYKPRQLWLMPHMLLEITTLTDFSGTITSDKYKLYPLDAPNWIEPQPYRWLEMLSSYYLSYGVDKNAAIAIDGKWGWSEIKYSRGLALSVDINSAVTAMTTTSDLELSFGDMLLLDSEQVFVAGVSGVNLTLVRGMNGTTAAAHTAAGTTVYQLFAHESVRVATCVIAERTMARGDSGWSDRAGDPTQGFSYFKEMPAEIRNDLSHMRQKFIPNYV